MTIEDFILSQDKKMRAKIFSALELLEIKGPELREPFSKSLGDGIFEVRAKQGSDISRVLYFFVVGRKVILKTECRPKVICPPGSAASGIPGEDDTPLKRQGQERVRVDRRI